MGVEEGHATLFFVVVFFQISITNYHAVGKDSRTAWGLCPSEAFFAAAAWDVSLQQRIITDWGNF